jgi:8-oxo-dGTP pyrophosphatase MutT (NUDIX family)
MDLSLLHNKDLFPTLVSAKLSDIKIDYSEKYELIKKNSPPAESHRGAGVVLLLKFCNSPQNSSEFVFQLIKRSDKVSQAGDISCPGGMLHPAIDKVLSYVLPALYKQTSRQPHIHDKKTISLIHLFLANALREAWEEIGLNPFNTLFLGALPCYSLTLFGRTIFPLVCLIEKDYQVKLSSEVEKIMEIPVKTFYDSANYALLEIERPPGQQVPGQSNEFPCLVLPDNRGNHDILWGATFNIITNFLAIISDNKFQIPPISRTFKKILTKSYITGNK